MKHNLRKSLKKIATIGFSAIAVLATAGSALVPTIKDIVNADDTLLCDIVQNSDGNLGGYKVTNSEGDAYTKDPMHRMYLGDPTNVAFCYEPHNITRGARGNWYTEAGTVNGEAAGYAYIGASYNDPKYYRAAQFLIWQTENATVTQSYQGSGVNVQQQMNEIVASYNAAVQSGETFSAKVYHSVGYTNANHQQTILSSIVKQQAYVDVDVAATVHKTSSNTSVTNNNQNYSLAGAKFKVDVTGPATWTEEVTTTDKDGNASFSHKFSKMDKGTTAANFNITVTEVSAPQGYQEPAAADASQTKNAASSPTFTFSDEAKNDPITIQVTKRAEDGSVVSNPKSLEGAEFKLNFYAVDPNTVITNQTPTRTWYITTTNRSGKYVATLSDAVNDSRSSALYTSSSGIVILPIGVLTIQETKAPSGYQIADNKFIDVNGATVAKDDNGIVTMRINADPQASSGASVNFGHEIIVSDQSVRGGFELQKFDSELGKADTQGNAQSLKASFEIINNNDYDVVAIDSAGNKTSAGPGQVVYTFETDDQGRFVSSNTLLSTGNYTIHETAGPVGYTLNGTTTASLTISDDPAQETELHKFIGTIADTPKRGGFAFQKKDAETGLSTPEGNAVVGPATYHVYNDSPNAVMVRGHLYQPQEEVYSFTTDDNGSYVSPDDLLPYGTYLILESEPPAGYNLDSTAAKGVSFTITDDRVIVSVEASNTVQRGGFTMAKRDYTDKSLTPEGNANLLGGTYNVVNHSTNAVLVDKNQDGLLDPATEMFAPGAVVFTFTTTEDNTEKGIYTSPANLLPYGSYSVVEAIPPMGYQGITDNGATTSVDFKIETEGQQVDLTGNDKIANTPQRGTFSVKKSDFYLGTNIPEGDNDLSGKYALVNKSAHAVYVDTNGNGKIDLGTEKFEPDEVIRDRSQDNASRKMQYSFTTAKDGTFSWTVPVNGKPSYWAGLPYGSYAVIEVEAPTNYTTKGNTLITFKIDQDGQEIDRTNNHDPEKIDENLISNEAAYGKVELYKHVNKQSGSEDDDVYENGAQFLVILTSKLNSLYGGDMKTAWTALKDQNGQNIKDADGNVILSSHEFSIVTTGTEKNADGKVMNGYGLSGDLATGKYTIMQFVSGTAKGYTPEDLKMKDESKEITITSNQTTNANGYSEWNNWKDIEDGNRLSVTNNEKVYNLRIVKEDAATGKTVTFNSASFKVYVDADGDGKLTEADRKYNSVKANGDIDYQYYLKDQGVTKIVNGVVTMTGSDGKEYDTFRTYSDNLGKIPAGTFVVNEVNATKIDKGSAVQPLTLKKGTYFVVETDSLGQEHATPEGYTTHIINAVDTGDIEYNGAKDDAVDSTTSVKVGKTDDNVEYLRFTINGTQYKEIKTSTVDDKDNNVITKIFSWFNNTTDWLSGTKRMDLDDDYFVTQKIANDRAWGELNVQKSIEKQPDGVDYSYIDRTEDIQKIQFNLYAAEDIIDPADGSVITKQGEVAKIYNPNTRSYTDLGIFHPDSKGNININYIPLGKYILKEVYTPDGINLQNDKSWDVNLVQPADNRTASRFNVKYAIKNTTTKAKFSKTNVTGDKELPGATITILHKDGSQVTKRDGTPLTWVSTDKPYFIEGLPEGDYLFQEVIAPKGYVLKSSTVPFTIKRTGEIQGTSMKDKTLTVQKIDMNKKAVDGAELTIYEIDVNGNHVKNDDGSDKVIDKLTYKSSDAKGLIANNLATGKTYEIVETVTPTGFATMKPYRFTVKDDDQNQLEIVKNKRVEVSKEDVGGKELPGAILTITDKNGNVVDKWTSTDKTHYAENLIVGETYTLHEDTTPAGYVMANDITFTVDDDGVDQKITMIDKIVTVIKTNTKGDPATGAEMTVYELDSKGNIIKNSDGSNKVIYTWTVAKNDKDGIMVENLIAGHTYQIVETKAPNGFVTITPYTLKVEDNNKNQTTTLVDKRVEISKEDVGGKEVKGAKMSVTDKDGNVVDSWISDGSKHSVNNLIEGQDYVLREDTAPLGYVKALDIPFTATGANKNGEKEDQHFVMNDKTLTLKKVDMKGKLVPGAEITIYEADDNGKAIIPDDGSYVDRITTAADVDALANNLAEDKTYVAVETKVPDGYVKFTDYTFTVAAADKDGKKSDQIEKLVDKRVEVSKVDVGGEELPGAILTITDKDGKVVDKWTSSDKTHYANGLKAGETYTLHEDTTPVGYVTATDITFKVNDDGVDQKVTMIDKRVQVSKEDVAGKEIKGAKMSITDKSGNIVDSWTSNGSKHNVKNLIEGQDYVLHEDTAPLGYVKALDIPFTATGANDKGEKENQHIEMTDKALTLKKVDMCGKKIAGAEITIYEADDNGKPIIPDDGSYIDRFITNADSDALANNLVENKTYVAVETKVPDGYVKFTDYTFTVAGADKQGKKSDQVEKLVDKQVSISKTDVGGKELPGAILTITDKDGKVVDKWTSSTEIHYTTGLIAGETYTLHEDTSPLGYVKATDVTFTVNDDGVDQKITMVDTIEKFAKYDGDGNLLKGVELEVVDENGNVVDTWKSGQHIQDLTEEQKKELQTGKEVTITEDETTVRIVPLHETDKTSFVDDKHDETNQINKDQACEYKASESTHASEKNDSVGSKNITGYEAIITDADGVISYKMIDLDGDEAEHMITGLTAGQKYTVKETKTIDGYYFDNDVSVNPDGKTDGTSSMVDNKINYEIIKIDEGGNKVKGVTLKLTDVTDAENSIVVSGVEGQTKDKDGNDTWVTTGDPIKLNGVLKADHKYELEETEIVGGVWQASVINFTVEHTGDGKLVTITMVDMNTHVNVLKTDNYGTPLKDAKLSIYNTKKDAAGNIIRNANGVAEKGDLLYSFTSTDDKHGVDISQYVKGGETYVIEEDEAPFGFEKITTQEFKVTGMQSAAQLIVLQDNRKPYTVELVKTDADTGKKLAGATLGLFYEDGSAVQTSNGQKAKGVTDSNGVVRFNVIYSDDLKGGKIYAQEIQAPKDYKLSTEHYNVKVTNVSDFDKDPAVRVVIANIPEHGTGISDPTVYVIIGAGAAAIMILLAILDREIFGKSAE